MSVSDSKISNATRQMPLSGHTGTISLNEVVKESLEKIHSRHKNVDVIVRFENLPFAFGKREELLQLFDLMLNSIFKSTSSGTKLFLFIDCIEAGKENGSVVDSTERDLFQIRFHTNIKCHDKWRSENEPALATCTEIISNHNGTFVVSDSNTSGCLFTITVPGKL
ncbi:MAG TPA: hypothetical protein VM101_07495 [Flavitalea sp.]|nr:hypothetical protein [Flavitalea sp.]